MKYWTFQKKSVVEKILQSGEYFPDFSCRENLSYLRESYRFALGLFKAYNTGYDTLKGLIFCFDRDINNPLLTSDDVKNFTNDSMMAKFIRKGTDLTPVSEYQLLELSGYPDTINTIPADIPFFTGFNELDITFSNSCWSIDPLKVAQAFIFGDYYRVSEMVQRWFSGQYTGPFFTNPGIQNILQHHLPYIKKENIDNIYPAEEYLSH